MNITSKIALRYFFSKKSLNIINIISRISITGITIGTFALIVVLSVFNGLDILIKSMFNKFDTDLKITPKTGKYIEYDSIKFEKIKQITGIELMSGSLDENALIEYKQQQMVVNIKGVESNFHLLNRMDTTVLHGKWLLEKDSNFYALIGGGIAWKMMINPENTIPLRVYMPTQHTSVSFNPDEAFQSISVWVSGVYYIQQEIDYKYVILPYHLVAELSENVGKYSYLELKMKNNANIFDVKNKILDILGKDFLVQDRYEQHEVLYKIMKSEKWIIFLILSFIIIIASFNITGSVTMLLLEKRKDINIMKSFGMENSQLVSIFTKHGMTVCLSGILLGAFLGYLFCYLQQKFGFIQLPVDGGFVINSYPIEFLWIDFFSIFGIVLIIGFLATYIPVRIAIKRIDKMPQKL